jgi:hypothetical protein
VRNHSGGRNAPRQLQEQARSNPGGWVYEVVGDYGPTDAVPPEAIRGAWKVDDSGSLTGEYQPNPKFRPQSTSK